MKIFLKYNNILYDNCMKMNFNMIVQFYKWNLFKIIQIVIFYKNMKYKMIIQKMLKMKTYYKY